MLTTGGLQLESFEDRSREVDEVITDRPFARPSSLLFLRYAWPVNCVSLGWPSWDGVEKQQKWSRKLDEASR